MCAEPAARRVPGMMNLRRTLTAIAALTVSAIALGLAAGGAFGQDEGVTDRLSVSHLFTSANCALTGNDCSAPSKPAGGTPTDPGPGTGTGGPKIIPRGKTDVGVFEFTVSGKQTTKWSLDETHGMGGDCTVHTTGSGQQTITLKSVEPGWAEFTSDKGQLIVNTNPPATVLATVARSGKLTSTPSNCPVVAWGDGKGATKPDCDKPISAKIGVRLITSELGRRGTPIGVTRDLDFTTLPKPDYQNCPFYGMKDDPFKNFGLMLANDDVTSLELQAALRDLRARCKKGAKKCKPKTVTLNAPAGAIRTDRLPGGSADTTITWTVVLTPTTREVPR